jgi:hypothetical protein
MKDGCGRRDTGAVRMGYITGIPDIGEDMSAIMEVSIMAMVIPEQVMKADTGKGKISIIIAPCPT